MTSAQPNVLVLMTDQHRYDAVGAAGASVCRTPALDALAADGTTFSRAYSTCALCSPARASIYTGRLPHRHGMIRNSEDPYCKTEFDDTDVLLSVHAARQGYDAYIVGKWHCGIRRLPRDFGFGGMNVPGYGECRETEEYRRYLDARGIRPGTIVPDGGGWWRNVVLCGIDTGPIEASVPYCVAQKTIETLDACARAARPFVLFANFWGPHAPYVPTEPYASMYDPADIEPWGSFEQEFDDKPRAHKVHRDAFVGESNRPRDWDECARWAARYYGFATMIDEQIGRILSALDSFGLSKDTIVVFTTDHGDLLGSHGGMHDKSSIMCEEIYHIPFLLRDPAGSSSLRGATVSVPVTNIDLFSTVLAAMGAPPDEAADSIDLLSFLRNGVDEAAKGRPPEVYCESHGNHYHYQSRMITDGKWKYIFNAPDIDELYDLEGDRWEIRNIATDPAFREIRDRMRERMIARAEESADPLVGWMRARFSPRMKSFTPYGAS